MGSTFLVFCTIVLWMGRRQRSGLRGKCSRSNNVDIFDRQENDSPKGEAGLEHLQTVSPL